MYNQELYELAMTPSVIRTLFNYGIMKAAEIGEDKIYDYSLGNPSIPAPASVNKAIHRITEETDSIKLHGYSMSQGFESTRKVIAENLNKRFGVNASAQNIFITCGAAPALIFSIKALITSPESEIIAIAPYFVEYKCFVENNGARLNVVPADTENFQVNIGELASHINPNTRGIIINSPNNPSGVIYTEETIRKIAKLLKEKSEEFGHSIYIIADEPYRELVYTDTLPPFIPALYDNTIVCYSWSKSLSLPGERIGYVYVSEKCEDAKELMATVGAAARASGHVCPPTLVQKVIEECIDEKPDLGAYIENRELLYGSLTEMGYECAKPDGAFYLFVKAPGGDDDAFSEKAKLEHNLLLVPGRIFECPGYLRLSYCVSNEMIRKSLPAFKKLIDSVK